MSLRDDQFWAAYLGVDPSEWATEGVSVRPHAGLAGYRGLWCFRRRDRVVVSAPAAWVSLLSESLIGCDPDALFDEAFLAERLGGDFERLIGPAFQGSLEPSRFRPAASAEVRLVAAEDSAAVERF